LTFSVPAGFQSICIPLPDMVGFRSSALVDIGTTLWIFVTGVVVRKFSVTGQIAQLLPLENLKPTTCWFLYVDCKGQSEAEPTGITCRMDHV
jgi:hypothetical protein